MTVGRCRGFAWITALVLVIGCGRLSFDPLPVSSLGEAPGDAASPALRNDAAIDGSTGGSPLRPNDASTGAGDSAVPDIDAAGPGIDAGGPDAGIDGGAGVDAGPGADAGSAGYDFCPSLDSNTVALFKMENPSSFVDETGDHPGTLSGNPIGAIAGPGLCGGQAYDYSGTTTRAYATVAHSPDWNLTRGSVEFWVYLTDYTGDGIVCRDAGGNGDGHLTILANATGHIVARLEDAATEYVRCSRDPLPLNTWHHIGVNFGPGEWRLFVDGVPGDRVGNVFGLTTSWTFDCNANGGATGGLTGNTNPWTIGSLCWQSTEGTNDTVGNTLSGYLDELRISRVQRPFD